MNLNVELPDELGAALQAQAQADGVSADRYVRRILEDTLRPEHRSAVSSQPFETGYGMWAKYGAAPSAEEIDENRREMFQKFAQGF